MTGCDGQHPADCLQEILFLNFTHSTTIYNDTVTVTLVPRDWRYVLPGGRQAVDPPAVDPPLRLHVVLEGAIHSGRQTGDVLRLQYQLHPGG